MNTLWLIKLLLAHLLGDFVLQPKKWVDDKLRHHFSSRYLYLHCLVIAAISLLMMGFSYWPIALIIFVTHVLIDGWKSYRPQTTVYFLVDQALHLLVITFCWLAQFYTPEAIQSFFKQLGGNFHLWVIATAFVLLSFPSGIAIGLMTRRWSDQIKDAKGLADAGKWIGILERLLILVFLIQNQYGAIGLLITAKGLLRFSEKDRQEEKTEYVLIGSLISVALAVVTGIVVKWLIQ